MKHISVRDKDGTAHIVKNNGREEQIYIEDHHPAIVDRELFRVVGELVNRGLLRSGRVTFSDDDRSLLRYAASICNAIET